MKYSQTTNKSVYKTSKGWAQQMAEEEDAGLFVEQTFSFERVHAMMSASEMDPFWHTVQLHINFIVIYFIYLKKKQQTDPKATDTAVEYKQ